MSEDAVLSLLDNRKTIYEILCLRFCTLIFSPVMHVSLRRWIMGGACHQEDSG